MRVAHGEFGMKGRWDRAEGEDGRWVMDDVEKGQDRAGQRSGSSKKERERRAKRKKASSPWNKRKEKSAKKEWESYSTAKL